MADPISVQDLDQFLKSPSPSKAKMDTPPPAPVSMGPGKPIPQIKNAADLDNFLKQPVQGFESYRKERLTGKRPASTEPSTLEKFGEAIPEWSVPALRGANYVAQLPVRAGEAGAKAVGEFAGNAVTSLASAFDLVGHPGRWGAYFPHQGPTAPVESPEATVEREYPNALPIVRGAAKAVGEVAGGTVADPRNWPFFFSSSARPILQRIISGGFGLQMATGTIQAAQNLLHNWSKMTPEQRTEAAVQGGLTAAMTYGALSHALSAHLAEEFLQKNPDATTDEVRTQTASRLEEIKNKLAGMPAAQRATELQAMGLPADLTIDHVQTALDHINSLRAERPAIEPPPPPPEKTHREGPDYYAINVRPMSPVERDARRYSLDEARKQLDAERNVAAQEQTARDAAEQERQRVARERQANVEGEAAYRAARAGRTLVVQERRPLEFNNGSAKANYEESQRLGEVLDNIAVEHMYENTEDMIRSLRMERYRGVDLKSKYGDWADNALKTEARQKEYLKLSDPRALEPKKTDVLRDTAQDIRLAEREMNMRDAANKIDREAQKNVTDPEVFEKAKAEADEARKLAEDLRTQRDEAAARRASQIADRQIYPVGAPIDLQVGSATEVLLPSGRRLPAHYAIALGDQIITSHNPLTFKWNDDYGPRQAQPRDYSTNQEAQAGVITGGSAPEPDRIHTDDPTAHNGPPVIRRDGLVLGGNGRTMRLQRAYRLGNGDVVFRHLRSKLGQFGLDSMPDLEKKPTLVRVLDDDVETAEDLFVLGRDLNRTETMGFDPAEQAVVAGRAISDQMLEWGTAQMDMLGEDASVRDFMRARGAEIVQRMIDSGMIEPTKRAAYVAKNGEMTEAAKDLFEAAWLGKIVDDADLLKTTPKEILRKLSRAVPGLMKAKAAGAMWDISPEVKQALDLWKRIDSIRDSLNEIGTKADSLVDKYLHPEDFENGTQLMDYGAGTARETPHPTVEAIAKLLEKPQVEVRNGFADYGNEAEGKQQTLGPPPEPVESFNRFIGSKVGIEINPDQWAVPMAEAPKAAVLAPEKALEPLSAAAATETTPAVPPPLETAPRAIEPLSDQPRDTVRRLRDVMKDHPGIQDVADEELIIADRIVRFEQGVSFEEFLRQHPEAMADVRTKQERGTGGLEQSIADLSGWARRAGKKLQITPYGEQLGLFGGAEPQFILRNRVGDERLVLKSELMKLRDAVPRVAEMVDADGNVKQPELFGAEEENLFGPGKEEEDDPQGTLFQVPPDLDSQLRDTFAKSKSVGSKEGDYFTKAKAELFPGRTNLSPSEIGKVSARALEMRKEAESLRQGKRGEVRYLDDGRRILYLYKTANASTFLHEFAHIIRPYLSPKSTAILEKWLKIKDGHWSRNDEENFSRSFEQDFRQRKVENLPPEVRSIFKKIQDAMRKIYEAVIDTEGRKRFDLTGSHNLVKASKEVTNLLFDRWYGMEAPPEAPGEARTDVEPTPPEPRGVEAVSQPAVQTATEAIPEELGPKKETIPAASEMEQPPLSTAEREGAELVAEGGRRLLDTGKVKAKVFPAFDEAQRWATTNAKKIRSLQMYRLRDGRYVADFVPQNEKVLFQRDETGDINREISDLQKRLMSIMPEEQRSRIAQRLFDLEERRRTVAAPATSLEPLPGKVVRLWTPEGEEAVVPPPLEVKRAETQPVRTAANEPARLPEPPRFGGVPERPEPSRIPRPEPAPGRPVRAGRGTEEPRVVGGQPTGTLRDVTPIRIDAPDRPSKPPVYSDKDWTDKVKLYELPENAPTPTVGISNNLARMLMGGQRYVVESALSGLDRYNSYVLAMPTGSGKTFQSAAILHHILGEKPDAQVLILTTSRGLIDSKGGFKDVMGDFGIEVQDLDKNGPTGAPGVYAETWAGSGNRPGIETHPWDLVIADEVQEARKWWSSQRGQRMKAMGGNAKNVLYMSATPFHCLAPGTPVLMYDGSIKQVQDVCVGELVMGPDSKPRQVRGLSHGFGQMYEVTPKKGDRYRVNENHVLSLRMAGRTLQFDSTFGKRYPGWRAHPQNSVVNISVRDYLQASKGFRERLLGYRTGVEFSSHAIPVDPYWLGLWLGDGLCRQAAVCVAQTDPEIRQYIQEYARKLGLITTEEKCSSPAVKILRISRGRRGSVKGKFGAIPHNPLTACLRNLGVTGKDSVNKHIPDIYKANSRDVRLQLLAGIIDSDGTCDQKGFSISTKSKRLASDILFLARSLGFAAYAKPIFYAKSKRPDLPNWAIRLSGDLEVVPTLLPRKQCRRRKFLHPAQDQPLSSSRNAKDVLKVGIRVDACGIGEFYGFELDGDQLFVLGDFTVTHNSALEIGHMDKLGLWDKEGYEAWAKQFGVHRDAEGNLAGGNAPLKLTKLRNQLIERGQFMSINKDMNGYSAHFGVVPMDGTTKQGLANIKEAMQLAENYFYAANKRGKVQPTRAQAVTLAKRWLEYSRLPQAIDLGKKLEAQGWKVIFFSENKKEFEDVFEFLQEADEGTGGRISQLLPRFPSVTDVLKQHFGDDIGIFAGKHSAARQEELTGFNEGDKKHIYATYGAGGVGVSLHDTVGNAPRAVIYLGPPWSGISFDQALGRPWRYGTRSNVRAYFLFSNAQAEMDVVTNKVAPRMESLRALVSGVHLTDPLVKALRDVPENREATLDYELGNEHRSDIDQFTKTGDVRTVTSYSELPVVSADEAKNKGMKLPGGDGATAPNVVRLFQGGAEDEVLPIEQEHPNLQVARNINVEFAERFIATGAAPGLETPRNLDPIGRRRVADYVMADADRRTRDNPGGAVQSVYTAWTNGMREIEAIQALLESGHLEPPPPPPDTPGGKEISPPPPQGWLGKTKTTLRAVDLLAMTRGRKAIIQWTKDAGVPEIGETLSRDYLNYLDAAGTQYAGTWDNEWHDIVKNNKLSPKEIEVLLLTMENRSNPKRWIDERLAELRTEAPMNDRIARAAEQTTALMNTVGNTAVRHDIYVTARGASGPKKIPYSEFMGRREGRPHVPHMYDYNKKITIRGEDGEPIVFTLRGLLDMQPGDGKREAIIRQMITKYEMKRSEVEDFLASKNRTVPLVGTVERPREVDLPWFRTDPQVLNGYFQGMGEVIARAKYFGQDGSKLAGMIAQIPDQHARTRVKETMDIALSPHRFEDEASAVVAFAANYGVTTKMTLSPLKVLGHSVHGAVALNIKSYLKGLVEVAANPKEALRFGRMASLTAAQDRIELLHEFGVRNRSIGDKALTWNGWNQLYKTGRIVTGVQGKVFMEEAIGDLIAKPDSPELRSDLREWLLLDNAKIDAAVARGRWTEDDLRWGAKAFSDRIMFRGDPLELPTMWRAHAEEKPASQLGNGVVRMATLLKGYQFKTHALLKDAIWEKAKHGNFKPLLRAALVEPLAGKMIWTLTALFTLNHKYFKDMMKDKTHPLVYWLEQYVDSVAHQIGDSALEAALEAYTHGKVTLGDKIVAEYFAGALATDLWRTAKLPFVLYGKKTNKGRRAEMRNYVIGTVPAARVPLNAIDDLSRHNRTTLEPLPPPPGP